MPGERRPPSAAERVAFVIALAQAAGAGTLALLSIKGAVGANLSGVLDASTGMLFLGTLFGLLGFLVLMCALLVLRGSLAARFGLVGTEVLLGAIGFALLPTVGLVVAISALLVVILDTLLSWIGRPQPIG